MATLAQVTRTINTRIARFGLRGKFSFVGSFAAFRIEDSARAVTAYQATEIAFIAGDILANELQLVDDMHPLANIYYANGVVMNWRRK